MQMTEFSEGEVIFFEPDHRLFCQAAISPELDEIKSLTSMLSSQTDKILPPAKP
jgi:hypothetical protein